MTDKQKPTIENIKQEAKQYYKWKNMIPRYIFIWFLLIIIALQFFLPNKLKENKVDVIKDNVVVDLDKNHESKFSFLNKGIDLNSQDYIFQLNLDNSIADIVDSKNKLSLLYKKSLSFLPSLELELKKEKIPLEFKYLVLLNNFEQPILDLNIEIQDRYSINVNNYVDERLNYELSKNASIEYIKYLYKDFQDWDLVMLAYFMWADELKSTMMDQNQKDFDNLYVAPEIISNYFKVMWYKYVFDNISEYIQISDVSSYFVPETSTIKLWETKDLIKRSKKEGYSFKEIKELNPRILWSSLPKGKREIKISK